MEIEFTGDFKSLKSMGYRYQKLFAHNYICYHKDELWIWKKGKQVEIEDFYGKSYKLLEYLIINNFIVKNKFNIVIFNNDTREMEDYDRTKNEDHYFIGKLNDEEMEEFYKKYKKVLLKQKTIDSLKELYENGWIKITTKKKE